MRTLSGLLRWVTAITLLLPLVATAQVPPDVPHYFGPYPNYATSPRIQKFVDPLPGLKTANPANTGQYIPIAFADTTTHANSDYYEIAVVQYRQKMHRDLPATLLRGYVQLETPANASVSKHFPLTNANLDGTTTPILRNGQPVFAVDEPRYLGPVIAATKDKPVRILFRNLLATGTGGDLFLPVDTTVMGAGMGPMMFDPETGKMMEEKDPQRPMCGQTPKPMGCYSENRATLHLHGGITPWISDGTPHQWITPAGETTSYPKGVSVVNVPDMPDPGPGAMTFFYTNQQSARLMFYHDHAWGITRLNVYAGEAAGYLITDAAEQKLITDGLIPGPADTIPLVVQDKTFVPSAADLQQQDPTWQAARWGGEGNLWLPHVYMPAQAPELLAGANDFGRWAYGPWFWPPTLGVDYGPIANPHFDPNCDSELGFCEPSMIPGVPFVSMGMEAFNDTPIVNGVAYPTLTVDPKKYRFRVLNAANDRFFNLQLYVADASGTEVALNPAEVLAAKDDPFVVFPTPDTTVSPRGPAWVQIGTEGGFLPAPVVVKNQFTTWVSDPTVFNAGNVDQHSLLVAPAERADVIVDFAPFAGKTLILYNDAPAAFPARDPRYDYYTDNADLRDVGGAAPTTAGFGPNTRTVMQITVTGTASGGATPADYVDTAALANLQAAFAHKADGSGVFESSQHKIIVGQAEYNSAYGTAFRKTAPNNGLAQIFDTKLSFDTVWGTKVAGFPLEPKAIQDEMGEAFERTYGRMSGNLGLEAPNAQAGLQILMLYPYPNPPTEVLSDTVLANAPVIGDGTQLWKITHNGVDTHPIHFHLFDVQLINRVGWDGIVRRPDPNELGWKDTVRVSPLEDTIVALRPNIPQVPFDLPNSVRLLDPSMPEGAVLASATQADANGLAIMSFAPNGDPIDIVNHYVNFGHEYVWHCHILSHEEMDMMRPIVVAATPKAPTALAATWTGSAVSLSWSDNSLGETSFVVQRATDAAFTSPTTVAQLAANATAFIDAVGAIAQAQTFYYRVLAANTVGDTADYSDPALNELPPGPAFPVKTAASASNSTVVTIPGVTVTLSASEPSPQAVGTSVLFTAAGEGGSGVYQYRFWLDDGSGWRIVQDYGPTSTWTMSGATAGTYRVAVHVRTSVSVFLDAQAILEYTFGEVATPATGVTLSAREPSPQPVGTSVLFTAAGEGGSGVYQYRFWLDDGSGWRIVQDYGPTSTWTMSGAAAGTYQVAVHVRTSATVFLDQQAIVVYVLSP